MMLFESISNLQRDNSPLEDPAEGRQGTSGQSPNAHILADVVLYLESIGSFIYSPKNLGYPAWMLELGTSVNAREH